MSADRDSRGTEPTIPEMPHGRAEMRATSQHEPNRHPHANSAARDDVIDVRAHMHISRLQSSTIDFMGRIDRRLQEGDARMNTQDDSLAEIKRTVDKLSDRMTSLSASIDRVFNRAFLVLVVCSAVTAGVLVAFLAFRVVTMIDEAQRKSAAAEHADARHARE